MGLEYRIPFLLQDADTLNQILRNAPHLANYDGLRSLYLYRANLTASTATMPDATAAVRENGFYFCEYGDQDVTKDVLAFLRHCIEATGQVFLVDDLE